MQLSREVGVGTKSRLHRQYNVAGGVCNSCHCSPTNQSGLNDRNEYRDTDKVGHTCFTNGGY